MKPENTDDEPPVVYAIGGPNGAGKTTFAREFLPAVGIEQFLNADSLAAGLSPLRPEAMAIPAARLLLERWRALVAARTSFAFESTFSGRTYAPMLRAARAAGYSVRVCYLWLPSDDASLHRVRNRVREGGHNVPSDDIRRRYLPSVRNFFELYLPLSDDTVLYEAAVTPPIRVARWTAASLEIFQPETYEKIRRQADLPPEN